MPKLEVFKVQWETLSPSQSSSVILHHSTSFFFFIACNSLWWCCIYVDIYCLYPHPVLLFFQSTGNYWATVCFNYVNYTQPRIFAFLWVLPRFNIGLLLTVNFTNAMMSIMSVFLLRNTCLSIISKNYI